MAMEHINNECCDMPLTLGTCSSEAETVSPMLRGVSTQKSDMERFNFKKLDEGEGQYQDSVSNTFTALEKLDDEVDINRAWETIRENIKIVAKESLGYYEFKQYQLWFHNGC
jgi:hypothetical protein